MNLTTSNDNVTVNTELSGNYYISIVSDEGENIDSIPCSSYSCTFQKPSGNFYIAINKHNYFPHIVYFNSTDNYIQNVTFDNDAYYINSPLSIGEYVTYEEMYGNVIIRNGKKLTIENGSGGVCIEDGFECEQGAILEIK